MYIKINGGIYTGRELIRSPDTYGWLAVALLIPVTGGLLLGFPCVASIATALCALALLLAAILHRS